VGNLLPTRLESAYSNRGSRPHGFDREGNKLPTLRDELAHRGFFIDPPASA
jgi:hypothetical protein